MPELPEVEVVRRGISAHAVGRTVTSVTVFNDRAVRNIPGGAQELVHKLVGKTIVDIDRRGKFMWLVLEDNTGVVIHLGMSGQVLVKDQQKLQELYGQQLEGLLPSQATLADKNARHLRIQVCLDNGTQLWFVDQRTFGYWKPGELISDHAQWVPQSVSHIAPDLLAVGERPEELLSVLHGKSTGIKRLLLNQNIVSGIGNIYADEMLWAAQIHPEQPANTLSVEELWTLLEHGQKIMRDAISRGGTSFDELYVNVNGQSGYFSLNLHAYGKQGQQCERCGTPIVREKFANRSSHLCPSCQKLKK